MTKSYSTLAAIVGPAKPAKRRIVTVFDAIVIAGHDEDFDPKPPADFQATSAPPGSAEKIDILAKRVETGSPLWHEDDRVDYTGLTGAVVPREKCDPRARATRHEAKMPSPRKEVGSGD